MAEHTETLAEPLPADPLAVVRDWLAQAQAANMQPNPNAMVLATSSRRSLATSSSTPTTSPRRGGSSRAILALPR
jgi:pyridoxine/pyridoxamine 5'-phosphate oxidase